MSTFGYVTALLASRIAALLPAGVHFDELWVEAEGGHTLSPLLGEEASIVLHAVEKRQREFRAGRQVARRALAQAGGPQVAILRGTHGAPQFPPGFSGSITHTGRARTYAAAVATRQPLLLGLDVELSEELSPELAERIATHAELDLARRISAEPGLLTFAAKEAVYKCVYPLCGRVLGFEEVRLELAEKDRLELRLLARESPIVIEVRWLRAFGLTACLATAAVGDSKLPR